MNDVEFALWQRRQHRLAYLRQYAENRRAAAKDTGARRLDVTLHGEMLEHFERVRQSLDDLNRTMIERGLYNQPKALADGTTLTIPAVRLSDQKIFEAALQIAARVLGDEPPRLDGDR